MTINKVDVDKFKETIEKAKKTPSVARRQWKLRAALLPAMQQPLKNGLQWKESYLKASR